MAGPWQCTHCGATWTARVGPCECGQDASPGWQPPLPKANDVLGTLWPLPQPPVELTPMEQRAQQPTDPQHHLYQQQQELVELGRQLDVAKQEQARTLQGVQAMLAPLAQWWHSQGRQVPVEQLIPLTVQALAALSQQRLAHGAVGPSAAAANVSPPMPPADALTQAIHKLITTIEKLDQRFAAPAEPYPTHVHTDAQLARLEQQAAFNAANTLPPGWER